MCSWSILKMCASVSAWATRCGWCCGRCASRAPSSCRPRRRTRRWCCSHRVLKGKPKGVVLPHRAILANIAQIRSVIDFSVYDKVLNALPIFHSFGLTAGALLPVLNGASLFLYPSPLHYRVIPVLTPKPIQLFGGRINPFRASDRPTPFTSHQAEFDSPYGGAWSLSLFSQSVFKMNLTSARAGEAERARRQASVAERARYGVRILKFAMRVGKFTLPPLRT